MQENEGVEVNVYYSDPANHPDEYILEVKSKVPGEQNQKKQYRVTAPDYALAEIGQESHIQNLQNPLLDPAQEIQDIIYRDFDEDTAKQIIAPEKPLHGEMERHRLSQPGVKIEVFKPSSHNIMRDVRVIKIENRCNGGEFDYILVKIPDYNIMEVRQDLPAGFTLVENVDGAGDRIGVAYNHATFAAPENIQQNLNNILGNGQGSLRKGMKAHSVNMRVYKDPVKKNGYIIQVGNLKDPERSNHSKYYRVDSQHYEKQPVELTGANINNLGRPLVQTAITEFGVSLQDFQSTDLQDLIAQQNHPIRKAIDRHGVRVTVHQELLTKRYVVCVTNLADSREIVQYEVDPDNNYHVQKIADDLNVPLVQLGQALPGCDIVKNKVGMADFGVSDIQGLARKETDPLRQAIEHHGVEVNVYEEKNTGNFIASIKDLANPNKVKYFRIDPTNNYNAMPTLIDPPPPAADQLSPALLQPPLKELGTGWADFDAQKVRSLVAQPNDELRRAIDSHHGVDLKVYKKPNSNNYILCITNLADPPDQKQYEINPTNNYGTTLLQNQNRIPIDQLGREIYSSQKHEFAYANFGDNEVAALVAQQDLDIPQAIKNHGVKLKVYKLPNTPYYFVRVENLANQNNVKYFRIDSGNYTIPPIEHPVQNVQAFEQDLIEVSINSIKRRGTGYEDFGVTQVQHLIAQNAGVRQQIDRDRVGVNVYKEVNSENYVVGISNFAEPDNITYYRIDPNNYAANPVRIDDGDPQLGDAFFTSLQYWNKYRYQDIQIDQVKELVESTNLHKLIDSDRAQLTVYRDPKNKDLNRASYIVNIRNSATPPEVKQFRIGIDPSNHNNINVERIKTMDTSKLLPVSLNMGNPFIVSDFKNFNGVALQNLYTNNNNILSNAINANRVKLNLYKESDSLSYILVVSNYKLPANQEEETLYRITPPNYTAENINVDDEDFDRSIIGNSLLPNPLEITHGVGYESFGEDKLNALLGKPNHSIRQAIDRNAVQLNIHKALNDRCYVVRIENIESPPKKKYCIIPITSDGGFDWGNCSILNSKEFKKRKLKLGEPLLTESQVQNNTVEYENFGVAQIQDLVSQANTPIRQAIDEDCVQFNIYPDPDDPDQNNPRNYILSVKNFETPPKEKQFSITRVKPHPDYPEEYDIAKDPLHPAKALDDQTSLLEHFSVPKATVGFENLGRKQIIQSSLNRKISEAINNHGIEVTALYKQADGKTCILEVTDIKDNNKKDYYSIDYSDSNAMTATYFPNYDTSDEKLLLLPQHKIRYRVNFDNFESANLNDLLADPDSPLRKRVDLYTKASFTIDEEGYFLVLPNGGLAFAPKKPDGSMPTDKDYQWIGSWESGYNKSTSAMQVNFHYNKGIPTESVREAISRARENSRLLDPFEGKYGVVPGLTNFVTEKDLKVFSSLSEAQNERNYYYLFYTNGVAVRVENGQYLKVGTWEPQYDKDGRPLLHINYDNKLEILNPEDVKGAQSISFIDEFLGKTPKDNFYDFKGREGKIWEFIQASKKPVEPEFELGMRNSESKTFIENLKKIEPWKETTEKAKGSDVYKLIYHDKKKEKNELPVELEYSKGIISTPRGKKVTARDVEKALDAMFVQIDSQIKAGKSPDKIGELVIYHRDPHAAEEIKEAFEERFQDKYETVPPKVIIVNSIEEFNKKMAGKTLNKLDQPQKDVEEYGHHYGM